MKRLALGLFAATLLGGSASAQAPSYPSTRVAPPASTTPLTSPAAPGADTCGATPMAGLVGQSRSTIPIPVDPSRRRVVCTTCPRTMDYRPDRLTVFYDQQSGRVTTLQCG